MRMNPPPAFADRHRRTRQDHAAETAEDYVRAVHLLECMQGRCRVTDLARAFGVSHVTVTKTIARLKREQLIHSERYGPIGLTKLGRDLAEKSQRQHSIVYEFLRAAGVSAETAEGDAEGIEHHVSCETLDCLLRLKNQLEPRQTHISPHELRPRA
jgi:DtxR family manganese transport transcriptional regulator